MPNELPREVEEALDGKAGRCFALGEDDEENFALEELCGELLACAQGEGVNDPEAVAVAIGKRLATIRSAVAAEHKAREQAEAAQNDLLRRILGELTNTHGGTMLPKCDTVNSLRAKLSNAAGIIRVTLARQETGQEVPKVCPTDDKRCTRNGGVCHPLNRVEGYRTDRPRPNFICLSKDVCKRPDPFHQQTDEEGKR